MLRMLRLNWSAMKCYRIRFLIIPGSLFVTGCFSPVLLVPMGTFLLFSFSLNPFAIEEKGDLNRLYLTLRCSGGRLSPADTSCLFSCSRRAPCWGWP